jgi:deaminated glutathione amidase
MPKRFAMYWTRPPAGSAATGAFQAERAGRFAASLTRFGLVCAVTSLLAMGAMRAQSIGPATAAPASEPSRRLHIATCQFPVSADVRANGDWVRRQMREAKGQGAELAHFPECALSGYAGADHPSLENFDWDLLRAETESILALARELGLWVVLGSTHPLTGAHKPHNSLYVITPEGRILDRYDKRFCVGADLKRYSPGDHFTVFEVNGVRCGLLICFDVRFPELYRQYVKLGVRVMFQSFYNARQPPGALSPIVVPATAQGHAANNFMFMSLANSSAAPSWPSRFITPDGIIAGTAPADEPAVMVNLVDLKKRYYDASRSFRLDSIDGKLNSGRTVDDPRSTDRTGY